MDETYRSTLTHIRIDDLTKRLSARVVCAGTADQLDTEQGLA
jgi:hypothetical protein